MKLGDVLYFPDYEFANGGHADKLFIVFSDPEKETLLLLIVTSKGKDSRNTGCQPAARRFLIRAGKYGFVKDTWVDLQRNVNVVGKDQLAALIAQGKAVIQFSIPTQVINEIKNCLTRHSIDLSLIHI